MLIGYPENFKGKRKANVVIGGGQMNANKETNKHLTIRHTRTNVKRKKNSNGRTYVKH